MHVPGATFMEHAGEAPGRGGGIRMGPDTVGTPALWAGFVGLVAGLLALDLGIFQRRPHAVGWREAATWSAVWIGLALLFNVGIYAWFGPQRALEFLTGYVIEKALSVDNLFVFLVIFGYFGIPSSLQHRVLFWGIVGALIMRAAAIVGGSVLLETFHWTIYLFGGFLVLTGVRLWRARRDGFRPETNPAVRLLVRLLPVTDRLDGARFTVRQNGGRRATPLLLALITVEVADVAFAVDSIPAIFAISSDPFIVFTSNIFAILGLRALYFLLAGGLLRIRLPERRARGRPGVCRRQDVPVGHRRRAGRGFPGRDRDAARHVGRGVVVQRIDSARRRGPALRERPP